MMKYLIAFLCALGFVAGIIVYLDHRDYEAEQRGVDKQIAADIARANQEIATRRVRDAQFDKNDARQHCLDAGLEWVFLDGKSFCR